MDLKYEDFKVDCIVEVKKGEDKGLFKVAKVTEYWDGQNPFFRVLLDRNDKTLGDERILEFYPNSPEEIYILKAFQTFSKADAQSWPPPEEIEIDGVAYKSFFAGDAHTEGLLASKNGAIRYDAEAVNTWGSGYDEEAVKHLKFSHDYKLKANDQNSRHWEYNGSHDEVLSIWLEDSVITMYTGYKTHQDFILVL